MSSVPISFTAGHLLDGKRENFSAWKQLVKVQLIQNKLWTGVVQNPDTHVDEQRDAAAQGIIRSLMTPQEANKAGMCETACELWEKLIENYEGSESQQRVNAGRQFIKFKASKGESLLTLCGRYEMLIGRLASVNYTINEMEKIEKFQDIVSGKIADWIEMWKLANKSGTLASLLTDIKAKFEYEDVKLDEPEDKAFFATNRSPNRGKFHNKFGGNKFNHNKPRLDGKPHQPRNNSGDKPWYKDMMCNHCNQKGHLWRYCRELTGKYDQKRENNQGRMNNHSNSGHFRSSSFQRNPHQQDNNSNPERRQMSVNEANPSSSRDYIQMALDDFENIDWDEIDVRGIWVSDSGCTNHMTGFREILSDYVPYDEPKPIMTAGFYRQSLGIGKFKYNHNGKTGYLSHVIYVKDLPFNLFSVTKVWNDGFRVVFDRDGKVKIFNGDNVAMTGSKVPHFLPAFPLEPADDDVVMFGCSIDEWHKRFGHSSSTKAIHNFKMVDGMHVDKNSTSNVPGECLACIAGKLCRAHHPSRSHTVASEDTSIIHFDTGHSSIDGPNGERYYLLGIEEYSGFRFVSCLITKVDAKYEVMQIINQVESATKKEIKFVVTDGGSEFCNNELNHWLKKKGILHEVTAPYTPQQNGIIERSIRAIKESATSSLIDSKLPPSFWTFACECAVYQLNRTPSPREQDKTRYEMLLGTKPNVSNLRVFGQYAYALKERIDKWSPKGRLVRFVGYTNRTNTYQMLDEETGKIYVTCNVRFLPLKFKTYEDIVINQVITDNRGPTLNSTLDFNNNDVNNQQASLRDISGTVALSGDNVNATFIRENNTLKDGNLVGNVDSNDVDRISNDLSRLSLETGIMRQDISTNLPQTSSQFSNMIENNSTTSSNEIDEIVDRNNAQPIVPATKLTNQNVSSRTRSKRPISFFVPNNTEDKTFFAVDGEPNSFEEAMSSPEKKEWEMAVKDELHSLYENNTWTVVNRSKNMNTIGSRWLFKNKLQPDGSIRRKARLVAQGFTQMHGIDFNETYAPVAMMLSIRLLVAIAVRCHLHLRQFDVKTAFLYGDIEEDIYLEVPVGVDVDGSSHLLKLNKALYGLKQSPRNWNKKFDEFIRKYGLNRSVNDPCLYYNHDLTIILVIYVDDGLIAARTQDLADDLIKHLKSFVKLTEGECKTYLGMQFAYNKRTDEIILYQEKYIEKILEDWEMIGCNSSVTPEELGVKNFDDYPKLEQDFPYKEIVGRLLYLTYATRPDICHAVNIICRATPAAKNQSSEPNNPPTIAHKEMIKRILRYLAGTKRWGTRFRGGRGDLISFSDADFANDMKDRKSTTGMVTLFANGPIMYRTARQKNISTSSTHAELNALSDLVKEIIPIRRLCSELKIITDGPTPIYVDNTSTIRISENGVSRQSTKHIDVRACWVNEQIENKVIDIHHVPGDAQVADMFTKPLPRQKFEWNRSMMMSIAILSIMIGMFTCVNCFQFARSPPVDFIPSSIRYINGLKEYEMGIYIVNPCKTYFNSSHNYNEYELDQTCCLWYEQDIVNSLYGCTPREYAQNYNSSNWYPTGNYTQVVGLNNIAQQQGIYSQHSHQISTNQILRHKRFAPLLVGLGFVVSAGGTCYVAYKEEKNAANIKLLEKSINSNKEILRKAIDSLVELRDATHTLEDRYSELEVKLGVLNTTIYNNAKYYNLLANSMHYFESLKYDLRDIDKDATNKKVSPRLRRMLKQQVDWPDDAEVNSDLQICRYARVEHGIILFLNFDIPTVDENISILEAEPMKFWNHTRSNKWCRLKYSGPRYVMVNKTSDCIMGIDSSWIDYNRIEGHTCMSKDSVSLDERAKLKLRYPAYTKEFCTNTYVPSELDIQMKVRNGFRRIYCRGFEIKINGEVHKCPHYPFRLPITTNFTLNNYTYEVASINKKITVDAEELQLNDEIVKELKIQDIVIKTNRSSFESISQVQDLFKLVGRNITLSEEDPFIHALFSPIEMMIHWVKSCWDWIVNSVKILIFLGLGIIIIIILRILFVAKFIWKRMKRLILWCISPVFSRDARRYVRVRRSERHLDV